MSDDPAPALITALQEPAAYPHAVESVRLVETHISWVLLAGDYAYKIKKPVDFGFLDFSSLAQRRHYCEEDLRLNRRFAPQLYLAVVPIGGRIDAPVVDGGGEPLEYAVKMREFPQDAQLDRVLARGELRRTHIGALAEHLADVHRRAAVAAADSGYGTAENVWQPMSQNFAQIRPRLRSLEALELLERVQRWSEERYAALHELLTQRRRDGYIRECHGDAHLGNIVLLDDRPVLFDCIEFNPNLRWIDVISESAFLTMDLHDRGRDDLAHRALNDYLQASGDYAGLHLLRFYQVYRALVRAKVACLRCAQSAGGERARTGLLQRERVTTRASEARDASEATLAVLEHQLQQYEPVSEDEARHILTIRTAQCPRRLSIRARRASASVPWCCTNNMCCWGGVRGRRRTACGRCRAASWIWARPCNRRSSVRCGKRRACRSVRARSCTPSTSSSVISMRACAFTTWWWTSARITSPARRPRATMRLMRAGSRSPCSIACNCIRRPRRCCVN